MTAQQFNAMLRFDAQFPSIYLRDFAEGRIRVIARNGDHLATICPPGLLCEDAVLLFKDAAESEFRGCYGTIAALLSAYQQANGNIDAVYETEEAMSDWDI